MNNEKYWTVNDDGTVGTAHTSRDGREVDFRPASAWADYAHASVVKVTPAPGVDLEPVFVPVTSRHEEKGLKTRSHQYYDMVLVGEWGGGRVQARVRCARSEKTPEGFSRDIAGAIEAYEHEARMTHEQWLIATAPLPGKFRGRLRRAGARRDAAVEATWRLHCENCAATPTPEGWTPQYQWAEAARSRRAGLRAELGV